mmetsp:Transcript_3060/g.4893  ORF Transcript_3060/g.4893 Transcript_3060/m.4893 type:complete len:257 (+) Transcript_3060:63-833(+)
MPTPGHTSLHSDACIVVTIVPPPPSVLIGVQRVDEPVHGVLEGLAGLDLVVVDVLPDADLRVAEELVLGIVALVHAGDLRPVLQVAHEGPGVHAVLAEVDLLGRDQLLALKDVPVAGPQHAGGLHVALRHVHAEGVEGHEHPRIHGDAGGPVLLADGRVGGRPVDGVAGGQVVGVGVDGGVHGHAGPNPNHKRASKQRAADRIPDGALSGLFRRRGHWPVVSIFWSHLPPRRVLVVKIIVIILTITAIVLRSGSLH